MCLREIEEEGREKEIYRKKGQKKKRRKAREKKRERERETKTQIYILYVQESLSIFKSDLPKKKGQDFWEMQYINIGEGERDIKEKRTEKREENQDLWSTLRERKKHREREREKR